MSNRFKNLNLQSNVVGSYDKTKTTIAGDVISRTVNGFPVLAPPLTTFFDPYTDTAGAFTGTMHYPSANGRLYELAAPAATGILTIIAYNYNFTTKVKGSLIGRISLLIPVAASTATIRSFMVNDNNTANIKIAFNFVGVTTVFGGAYAAYNIAISDFTALPTVIGMGLSTNAKAVYRLADPAFPGAVNNMIAFAGGDMDSSGSTFYCQHGLAAAAVWYKFDLTASPTILLQTVTAPNVNAGVTTFTITAHGYAVNDTVVITANAPTGFTASAVNVAPQVYFVRNPTANTFELSLTTGGASILGTTVSSSTIFTRAFGETTSAFLLKTGTVSGLAGQTLLLTNSQQIVTPTDGPNAGSTVYFFGSSTALWQAKLSEITSGATTFPSMATVNILGSGSDITAPTAVQTVHMPEIGQTVILIASSTFIVKNWQNNNINAVMGGQQQAWLENSGLASAPAALTTVSFMSARLGMLFVSGSTVGQRVTLAVDVQCDITFGLSYLISPIVATPGWVFHAADTIEQLFDVTDSVQVYYRTAATIGDSVFNTAAGGWLALPNQIDLASYALSNYTQFKIGYYVASYFANSPAQIQDLRVEYELLSDNSDGWIGVADGTTQGAGSPADSIWELRSLYATSVPTLYTRDVDKSTNNALTTANTSANASQFNYSTDSGASWNSLGTIPNVVGTRVRWRRTQPGGQQALVSIRES